MKVKFKLSPGAQQPTRGTQGSGGYDLYAPDDIRIPAGRVVVVHSGVSLEMPESWKRVIEGQIRGRSSMNKRGLVVLLGTIDNDYRGVIGATILNTTAEDQVVRKGERFAQLVFAEVLHLDWEEAEELTETARGTGGFGSTGI